MISPFLPTWLPHVRLMGLILEAQLPSLYTKPNILPERLKWARCQTVGPLFLSSCKIPPVGDLMAQASALNPDLPNWKYQRGERFEANVAAWLMH